MTRDGIEVLPPAELAGYILGEEGSDYHLDAYRLQGTEIRDQIVRRLGSAWSWDGSRVLDFGCGAGRVLRQLIPLADGAELHGCDIDEACVAWVREHLSPPVKVRLSTFEPPLDYPDGHFDFVYATSVFSHLTDSWARWLIELRRILKPGGRLVATVMGSASSEAIAGEDWDPDRIGMAIRGYGRPWPAGGPMVLHSEWWIRAHWGRAFEILSYDEGGICGQDAVMLRKGVEEPPSPDDLRSAEPNEPREILAAQHAIDLLHREHAELNASHDAYASAYAQEAERRQAADAELSAVRAELSVAQAEIARLRGRTVRRRARRLLGT